MGFWKKCRKSVTVTAASELAGGCGPAGAVRLRVGVALLSPPFGALQENSGIVDDLAQRCNTDLGNRIQKDGRI